jgi:hypothetical protein
MAVERAMLGRSWLTQIDEKLQLILQLKWISRRLTFFTTDSWLELKKNPKDRHLALLLFCANSSERPAPLHPSMDPVHDPDTPPRWNTVAVASTWRRQWLGRPAQNDGVWAFGAKLRRASRAQRRQEPRRDAQMRGRGGEVGAKEPCAAHENRYGARKEGGRAGSTQESSILRG